MRSCDGCTECCTILEIMEVESFQWTPCKHQCDHGCAIYERRPSNCASFYCLWLQGFDDEEQRPDRSGLLLVEYPPEEHGLAIFETRPNVLQTRTDVEELLDQYRRMIQFARASGWNHDRLHFVPFESRGFDLFVDDASVDLFLELWECYAGVLPPSLKTGTEIEP